jgi:hypothetical protein
MLRNFVPIPSSGWSQQHASTNFGKIVTKFFDFDYVWVQLMFNGQPYFLAVTDLDFVT